MRIRERRLDPEEDPMRWHAALLRSRVPSLFWQAKAELVKGDSAWLLDVIENPEWAENGQGWYIHGPYNSGKSAIAAILCMEMIRRCERVMWLGVREVPAIRFRENDEYAALNHLLPTVDLLVIDDIGAQGFRLSGAGGTALEDTVRILYERKRPVIYTSNIGWATLPNLFAEVPSLVSLIQRTAGPVAVRGDWGGRS